ncbi:hypothetical protein [Frigoriglobus tundricola]|uniref:Uncharacterized protein n=1 Tax=Frigoriglobus tundricola TaxID=2774151 RepID=A0A6M5YNA3_9BACT|nr:hypothetical protein [Frigoriglobus tundricola]QJW95398.1 hypothetical protein FTUN_2947 [Frigoriglobus tundricola]
MLQNKAPQEAAVLNPKGTEGGSGYPRAGEVGYPTDQCSPPVDNRLQEPSMSAWDRLKHYLGFAPDRDRGDPPAPPINSAPDRDTPAEDALRAKARDAIRAAARVGLSGPQEHSAGDLGGLFPGGTGPRPESDGEADQGRDKLRERDIER